jgi:hypothetical protein
LIRKRMICLPLGVIGVSTQYRRSGFVGSACISMHPFISAIWNTLRQPKSVISHKRTSPFAANEYNWYSLNGLRKQPITLSLCPTYRITNSRRSKQECLLIRCYLHHKYVYYCCDKWITFYMLQRKNKNGYVSSVLSIGFELTREPPITFPIDHTIF